MRSREFLPKVCSHAEDLEGQVSVKGRGWANVSLRVCQAVAASVPLRGEGRSLVSLPGEGWGREVFSP